MRYPFFFEPLVYAFATIFAAGVFGAGAAVFVCGRTETGAAFAGVPSPYRAFIPALRAARAAAAGDFPAF
jgi:hypothetical protein